MGRDGSCFRVLKGANADGTAGINAEDFVEGVNRSRCRRDDRAANNGHFALVNVTAPNGKSAIDDGGNPQHKAKHHDYRQTVADAGFQVR